MKLIKMNLATFLLAAGFASIVDDAWQSPEQNLARKSFVKDPSVVNVLDIGFGAGYLAETLLESNTNIKVVSFENNPKPYTTKAKEYIDSVYPGRHTLILSGQILQYINENRGRKFDVIFYDDRQDYKAARSDLEIGFKLAHENTIVIANNAKSVKPKNISDAFLSPAWEEYILDGKVIEIKRKSFGSGNRLIWGKYNLNFNEIKSLDTFLAEGGFTDFEENIGQNPEETLTLQSFVRNPWIKNVLEIGFGAGHSANAILKANPSLTLVSFDIGSNSYVSSSKSFIDKTYPGRHKLILGDSTKTVPQYIQENPGITFDFIFVDGGHQYETVKADLNNCGYVAHKHTVVALHDVFYTPYGVPQELKGPIDAWIESRKNNLVTEIDFWDFQPNRGIVWGHYNVDFYQDKI